MPDSQLFLNAASFSKEVAHYLDPSLIGSLPFFGFTIDVFWRRAFGFGSLSPMMNQRDPTAGSLCLWLTCRGVGRELELGLGGGSLYLTHLRDRLCHARVTVLSVADLLGREYAGPRRVPASRQQACS